MLGGSQYEKLITESDQRIRQHHLNPEERAGLNLAQQLLWSKRLLEYTIAIICHFVLIAVYSLRLTPYGTAGSA
jgi:hypothetical protein